MSTSERIYLTPQPIYTENTGLLRNQRIRFRQFQCCLCASILVVLVICLVAMISYSLSIIDFNPPEDSSYSSNFSYLKTQLLELNPTLFRLSDKEWAEALDAGNHAIEKRSIIDESAKIILANQLSPNIRHNNAVKTSLHAGKLAMAGIGELGATKYILEVRRNNKTKFNFADGAFFYGNWAPIESCREYFLSECNFTDKYRTYDGTCNHPRNHGAAFTPFARNLPPDYADGIEEPRVSKSKKPLPSARKISLRVHNPSPSSNPSFTVMLAVFGQFLDHDITATALSQGKNGSRLACCSSDEPKHPECFSVLVGPGDPVYDVAGFDCMDFVRSAPAMQCKIGPRQQLNQVTAFIDGSVVYGADEMLAHSLREHKNGLLKMFITPDGRTLLPQSTNLNDGCNREIENERGRYCFVTGDPRANENLHLTTMHLIWARQHNLIASQLHKINPDWNDERLYQETRRIIAAQLQHITYNEFLPIVLGKNEMKRLNLTLLKLNEYRHYNFDKKTSSIDDPAIANCFATAAFRFAHTLLPGLMKITNAEKGSEDWIQLHKMLFNPYSLYSETGVRDSIISATSNLIQMTSTHVTSQLTHHLFEDPFEDSSMTNEFKNQTFVPCGLDLVSLNIQRGRDHGLPGYTAWREYCDLKRPRNFNELKGILDPDSLEGIQELYEDVDDIDLYTGALAEVKIQNDGLLGPLFTCLVGQQFQRLQLGDRFWYEYDHQSYPFTKEQLLQLRKTSLARIICDCSDNIDYIQPQVMRSVDSTNLITLCEDIPSVDFTAWKENESTIN
ncbi:peroxidasin homolog [Chelonus insularis]|uniref:peroxidasin homolog n=1 Tax=Chelonus insularis TaxID=460826 RepID=UPI00158895EE|nr:peroxidasin homolog [Chelonus insularis]